MKGKEKCKTLKAIRLDIAKKNGIELEIPECTHKGDCPGSCPRCEAEVKYLERQLELRRRRGIKPILASISAGLITLSTASCEIFPPADTLQGDMQPGTSGESIEDTVQPDTNRTETGSITYNPDSTEEYVLDGDIAFPIKGDLIYTGEDDDEDSEILYGGIPLYTEDTEKIETEGSLHISSESDE